MGKLFGFRGKNAVSALCLTLVGVMGAGAEPQAFPEALGFGANVTGGRGGAVYHVTNLNDSGAGSFRDAVSQGNRIVVFDVGGIINIKTAVSIKSNITIAGQTAPGEGIAIHGGKLSTGKQSNIIIRYLRIRPGENTASQKDDGLNLYDSKNVIVDHCSVELAPWNNFGGSSDNANYRITGVTVQNTLVANPIYQQFGAHIESVDGTWAWYYNAFMNTHNRNPLDKINDVFVNNIHYNFEAGYTTHTSTKFKHDIVNNYFVYGPKGSNPWFQVDKNQSIYASGNMIDNNRNGKLDGGASNVYWYQGTGTVLNEPWSELTKNGPILSAASAWRYVNSQSGVLPYDDMDSLIWYQASTLGTAGALVKSVAAVGVKTNNGWGEVQTGTPAKDSDKDGMPDYFEEAMGYDVSKDDAMTKESDGYVRIEKYMNWLGAMHTKVPQNGSGDFDLHTITRGFLPVSPTYSIVSAEKGTASIMNDGHTVRFTPNATYKGLASFKYTVKGNDGTEYTGRVEVLVEKSDIVIGPSLSQVSGSVNQSIMLGESIENIVYKYSACGGASVDGLPEGVDFAVNAKDSTITISGKPTAAGTYKFTIFTTEDGGKPFEISGDISVRAAAKVVAAPASFGSIVNAAYPADGIGTYEDKNVNWIDSGYYNFNNSPDSYGIWNLNSENAQKNTSLTIRYASGSADQVSRYMELFVNNVSQGIVEFPPTANWTTWDSVTVHVTLSKGVNMLKMISLDDNGGPNVDEFEFEVAGITLYKGDVNPEDIVGNQEDDCEEGKEDECDTTTAIVNATTIPLTHAAVAKFDLDRGTIFASRAGFATVSVYDMSGRLVAKFSGNVNAGTTRLDFKKSSLPMGRYESKVSFR